MYTHLPKNQPAETFGIFGCRRVKAGRIMAKIGRNDACPCGSGKKYKACHWGKPLPASGVVNTPKALTFDELIVRYNAMPIAKIIGILLIDPLNHGRNIRLEDMARKALLGSANDSPQKPNAYWDLIKQAVVGYTELSELEAPSPTFFTENIVFREGNQIVYPGIDVSATSTLNQLLESIFLTKVDLPASYKKLVGEAVGILLFLSNDVAKDLGHERHIHVEPTGSDIVFPEHQAAMDKIDAVLFSSEYIQHFCDSCKYDSAILQRFIISPDETTLTKNDPSENPVTLKPFVRTDNGVFLYMPTAMVSSLIDFIWTLAREQNCYQPLLEMYESRQFTKTIKALEEMGWHRAHIALPEMPADDFSSEAVFEIDSNKLA